MRRVRPNSRSARLLAAGALGVLAVVSVWSADTASNSVPPSRLGESFHPTSPNELKPPECAALTLVNTIVATGQTLTGTNQADLLIGNASTRTISGRQGNDCIVGNAGSQTLDGGGGYDVCLGFATTVFTRCEVQVIR